MSKAGFLSTAAVILGVMGGQVSAQSLRDAGPPAEFPPDSFTGTQYVDSRGCVFVRAGIGGVTNWVPRVNRDRELLCGFQPTIASGSTTPTPAPTPQNAPNPLDTQVAEAPAATPAAAPAPARPAASTNTGLPTSVANSVNPLTGRPTAQEDARLAAGLANPSPQVIRQPAAQATPAAAPAQRTITRAEACAGRTGIQPNMISARTGAPINCGSVPQQVAAPAPSAAPAAQPLRMTRAEACAHMAATGQRLMNAATRQPIACAPSAGGTQIASAQVPTGNNAWDRIRADLRAPQTPYSNPLDYPPGSARVRGTVVASNTGYRNPLDGAPGGYATPNRTLAQGGTVVPGLGTVNTPTASVPGMGTVNTPTARAQGLSYGVPGQTASAGCMGYDDGTGDMRCGPQWQPVATSGGQQVVTQRAQSGNGLGQLFGQQPPPYSNPTYARQNIESNPPEGYQMAWSDGRLNPNRGLPRTAQYPVVSYATQPTVATAEQPRVSTRAAPQTTRQQPSVEAISGQRYVQVGTFSTRDNAQAVAQQLRARGLPMRIGVYERNGQQYRIVLAGPFQSANQLQRALSTARGAGYSDAFARN